jgi:hypothetical protein
MDAIMGSEPKLDWDQDILLLSTDWFLPFWEIFGLIYDIKQKNLIQNCAQETVKKFMKNSESFWFRGHSPNQFIERKSDFINGLLRSGLREKGINRLFVALLEAGARESHEESGTQWLFAMITNSLRNGDPAFTTDTLQLPLRKKLSDALVKAKVFPQLDFETANLSSVTHWDKYVRNLTLDLPSMLSDYVAGFTIGGEFKQFWCALIRDLNAVQTKELLTWYINAAKQLADPGFVPHLPAWMKIDN